MDNTGSHPNIKLSNVQLQYLPPNTTSKLQPLDAGVIANFKVNYRKLLLQNILIEIDNCSNVSELAKNVTLLEAIRFLKMSCKQILPSTIVKCFSKCGFLFEDCEIREAGKRNTETTEV